MSKLNKEPKVVLFRSQVALGSISKQLHSSEDKSNLSKKLNQVIEELIELEKAINNDQ